MKAKFFLLVTLTILSFTLKAADMETEKTLGSISGSVSDYKTKEPVPFATISLYKNDDTTQIVKGLVSDNDGTYIIKELPYGEYNLKVSFVGYNPVKIKNIKLNRGEPELELGNVVLTESVEAISEVEIVQERLKGEEQIDKTVYTINDQVRNSSTSGLDMLKHIPSVTVDFQENVTVEGESDILFFVDGIERNKDYVAQLDPKLIDKVSGRRWTLSGESHPQPRSSRKRLCGRKIQCRYFFSDQYSSG